MCDHELCDQQRPRDRIRDQYPYFKLKEEFDVKESKIKFIRLRIVYLRILLNFIVKKSAIDKVADLKHEFGFLLRFRKLKYKRFFRQQLKLKDKCILICILRRYDTL